MFNISVQGKRMLRKNHTLILQIEKKKRLICLYHN